MTNTLDSLYNALGDSPRFLLEADLTPIQGGRFQPTGFPDLGAAIYKRPDGTDMLLVESAQSMANRLEAVCWDDANRRIAAPLSNLPHVVVDLGNGQSTNSVQEAHRLNSPYVVGEGGPVRQTILGAVGDPERGALDLRALAKAVFSLDVGSVLHGVFLEKIAGRLRLQRLLSSFIEAENVLPAYSGGVKLDHVDPKGDAKKGYGNVPFSRTEFSAEKITAFFNLDLATMRGYGLGEEANRLLVALSVYKILKVLDGGLRLRTACDLEARALTIKRPEGLAIDDPAALVGEVERLLPDLIAACGFDERAVTRVSAKVPERKKGAEKSEKAGEDAGE